MVHDLKIPKLFFTAIGTLLNFINISPFIALHMIQFYPKRSALTLLMFWALQTLQAQINTQTDELRKYSVSLKKEYEENRKKALALAKQKGWPTEMQLPNGGIMLLTGVTPHGYPEYTATDSNVGAAATTGANQLWPNGPLALNLTGSSNFLRDKLALWDGGRVRATHVELTNRVVVMDNAGSNDDHATHVAGTMIAAGVNAVARGMAYQAPNIHSYDFNSDNAEMSFAAGNYILSNHSYGAIAGWRNNNGTWEFWGDFGETEDYKFGFYDSKSRVWDSIAFAAPYYLIVKSAGNNRNQNGPAPGTNFRRFDANGQMSPAPAPYDGSLSRNDSYGIISTYGNAKNILTVAAVNIISDGYTNPSDVQISAFSSWGPSDDGRIKPEIAAAGVGLTSPTAASDNAYGTLSGTSMSAPNTTGSLLLLQEYYHRETQQFMRSATLRGLAIHTANEAGSTPGPDYVYGFGLLNAARAAEVIRGRNQHHRILEQTLAQGQTYTLQVVASGTGPLVATLCWTDPPAISNFETRLNDTTPKLINDLDIRIKRGNEVYAPWILNRQSPWLPATTGDNRLDNVEKIEINNAIPGETYTIEITHKGNLQNNQQAYSLILSGVGGTAYCASQPATNNDSRIDNFTFAGINVTGNNCTQYTNATATVGTVIPGQDIPYSLTLGTCGTNKEKIAKIFADWNNDGDFEDAGETVAVSDVINTTATINGVIAVPGNLNIGTRTRLRIVVAETNQAATVTPCGTFAGGGETQDFTLTVARAAVDAIPVTVISPADDDCSSNEKFIAVRIKNNGSSNLNILPVTTVVRNGNTVVATLTDTVRSPFNSGKTITVYHSKPIITTPGTTYQFTTYTSLENESNRRNDTISVSRTTAPLSNTTVSALSGQICNGGDAKLNATLNGNGNVFWYTAATGGNPIGAGNSITTSNIPSNRTYYAGINDAAGILGPSSKADLSLASSNGSPSGGYNVFGPSLKISVAAPLVIESARMYFGNHGRIVVSVVNELTSATVAQTVLDVTATSAIASTAAQDNDLQDTGRIMPLNLHIPAPGNYLLSISYENGATIFRNNNILTSPYPMSIPGLITITGNTATSNSETFYYYFYGMKVRSAGCATSQPRVPVVANAPLTPVITQNGNVLNSNISSGSFIWLLNGTVVEGANSATLTITQGGVYKVLVSSGGCTFESPDYTAVLTSVQNLDPTFIGLTVTPNPAREKASIRFTVDKREQVALELLDITGKRIYNEQFTALPGSIITRELALQQLSAGTYFIKIYFDNKQFIRRLMISK